MTGRADRIAAMSPETSFGVVSDRLQIQPVPGDWRSAALLGACYFIAAGISVLSTRFNGDIAYCWIATALLMPRLAQLPVRRWLPPLAACAIASMLATTFLGAGASVAAPFAVLLMGEAALGALLLQRFMPDGRYFDDVPSVLRFAAIVAGVIPVLAAFGGGMIGILAFGMNFWSGWLAWFSVHAPGTLAFMPIVVMVTEQTGRCHLSDFDPRRVSGISLMLAVSTAIVAAIVFGQTTALLLFLPMLPLTMLTFRTGRFGAVLGICLIAIIGGGLTLAGNGPINVAADSDTVRALFFQVYLAITVATTLPMAAELNRRKAIAGQLKASEAMFRLIVDRSGDVLLNLDVAGRIRYCSPSIRRFGGFDTAALVGMNSANLIFEDDRIFAAAMHGRAVARPNETFVFEYRTMTNGDTATWFESHSRAIVDSDGTVTGVVSAARDISDRKHAQSKLVDAVNTDALTGIGNRRMFDEQLRPAVGASDRTAQAGCLAILDIDFFKKVNDVHGHCAGDQVLKAVAARLQPMLRSTDLVARIGGEEFGLVLWNLQIADANSLCDRLRDDIARLRVDIGAATIGVTVSIGIAELAQHDTLPAMMAAADLALYRAKHDGRNCVRLAA